MTNMGEGDLDPLVPNMDLGARLDWPIRAFVPTWSVALDDVTTERLSDALLTAVMKISPVVRAFHPVMLFFGAMPTFVLDVGTGRDIYVADTSVDPLASATSDRVYLDARRLAALSREPIDWAALFILEELVHAWLNVADEGLAKMITARLFGGVLAIGERYVPIEQAAADLQAMFAP